MEESHPGATRLTPPRGVPLEQERLFGGQDRYRQSERENLSLVWSTQQRFIDHAGLEIFDRLYKCLRNNKTKSIFFFLFYNINFKIYFHRKYLSLLE